MLKKMSPETLEAIRQKEWIREFVTKAAEKKLANLSLPDLNRSAITILKDEFESCFAGIIEDDGDCCDKVCALGAIEAAAGIIALSRPAMGRLWRSDDDIFKRELSRPARDKRAADTKERNIKIAGLLRDIEKKGTPLRAGEVHIETHILGKLPAMICGKQRPKAGTIKSIIRRMNGGQF
jgi:hypothetical protein